MGKSKDEQEFTKLRVKKVTIKKLQKIKASQEVKDGRRRFLHELIDIWADRQLDKLIKANKI